MNKTGINLEHPFVEQIRKHYSYSTPRPPKPGLFAALRYYQGVAAVILNSAWTARHGKFDNQDWFNRSYYSLKNLEKVGGSIEISGLEHLAAQKGPYVIVSNHMSLLETFLFPCILLPFNHVCFVLKKELTEYPGFGKAMNAINRIAVSRDNPRADFRLVMEEGLDYLQNGISVLIFPQATRNTVFIPSEFNTLGEKLAAKAGVPIIPAAVKTDLHGNGRIFKEFGKIDPSKPVHVVIGPALDPIKEGRLVHDKIIRFIGDHLRSWGLPVQDTAPAAETPS